MARRRSPSGFARYSEGDYLLFPATPGVGLGGGVATGALTGVGNVFYVITKLARRMRDAAGSRYVFSTGSTNTGDGTGRGMRVNIPASGTQELGGNLEAVIYRVGTFGVGPVGPRLDSGWGPMTIALGTSDGAAGDWRYRETTAHVPTQDLSGTSATAIADQTDLYVGRRNDGADATMGPLAWVATAVLTVEPSLAELQAFSVKDAMAWDCWPASSIWSLHHVGAMEDAGPNWQVPSWSEQAGPATTMTLGTAVSDANLTPWTEPEIAWPTQAMALATGDLVSGAGVRWLESATGRTFGTVTGREFWMKGTRDADGATSSRHYHDAYQTGTTRTSFVRNSAVAFPGQTVIVNGQAGKGPTYNFGVAGDLTASAVSAIGNGASSLGGYAGYVAGVKVAGTTTGVAIVPAERISVSNRPETGTDNVNHLAQEAVYLTRLSVGDEWLTYSSNSGVDPRLIWGPDCQHVWSLAYIDIDTQSVPDIVDSASALDALDVQGTAATADNIIDINASGVPQFQSFSDGFSDGFGD